MEIGRKGSDWLEGGKEIVIEEHRFWVLASWYRFYSWNQTTIEPEIDFSCVIM